MEIVITKALIVDLKRDEGLRLKPYRCSAGRLTIGFGRNLDDKGITKAEAELMLNEDLFDSIDEAKKLFADQWVHLDETRQRVIVNMIFNLGINRFKGFKRLINAINNKDYQLAAKEMEDSLWYSQVGSRAVRLFKMMKG